MCSNSKYSILRETYGKEKIANKVTSTHKVAGRDAFSLLVLSVDVSQLWPGVTVPA